MSKQKKLSKGLTQNSIWQNNIWQNSILQNNIFQNCFWGALISAVVGVAVLLLLCYAVSYPLAKSNSPEGLIPWCAVACVTLSGVVSGALGCIFAKRVLPYAFFSGALLLIAFLLMSVAFEATQTESLAFKTAICVCTLAGSLAGGLLAQKNKKPSHKSNSAYHKHVRK